MIEFWERILSRPKWQRVLLWIGSVGLIAYFIWFFAISDDFDNMQSHAEKAEGLDSQIAIETGKLKNLPILRKELDYYNELYGRALEMLPRRGQVESLLQAVSDLAKDSGLTVRVFTPRTEIKKQFFAEIPVDVEMKGNFHQMEIFLDELSRIPRIVNVQDILIDNPRGSKEGGQVEVDIRAVLKTFRYLEESERPQAPDSGKSSSNN